MRRWLAPVVAALVMAIGAVVLFGPYLVRSRQFVSSTGASPPFSEVTPVTLRPRSTACMTNVTINPDAGFAQFTVISASPPTPPLEVTADAPSGYRSPETRLPGGYRAPAPQVARLSPPQRSVVGRVCVRNAGRTGVDLVGTTEPRTSGRERTTIDGERVRPDVQLTLLEAQPRRLLAGVPDVLRHMAAFKGVLVVPGLLWIVAGMVALGVPGAVLLALTSGSRGGCSDVERDDDRADVSASSAGPPAAVG